MASVTRVVETLALLTDGNAEDLRARARYLRQAGMLSTGGRGKGAPDATEQDAVVLLLALMAQGPQVDCPQTVNRLLNLRCTGGWREETIGRRQDGADIKATFPISWADMSAPLGGLLITAVKSAHAVGDRNALMQTVKAFCVWHGGDTALIELTNGDRAHYEEIRDPKAPAPALAPVRIRTMATIDRHIVGHLSDLTRPTQRSLQLEKTLPAEKTNAPRPEASEAFDESVVPQPPARAADPLTHPDSDTHTESVATGEIAESPKIIGLDQRRDTPAHDYGSIQPHGIARRA